MRPGADRTWVLLVAVDRYDPAAGLDDLPGPAGDAEAVLDWARGHGVPPEQCRVHLGTRSRARDGDGRLRDDVAARLGVPVVELPSGTARGHGFVPPGTLPVFDARKPTVEESLAELVALAPQPDSHLHVFLLGHGVTLGHPPRRVFLTEDVSLDLPDRNLPLSETDHGSLVDALASTAFREVFVYYDACSTAAFPEDKRELLAVGTLGTKIAPPRRDTAVTVCLGSGIYEAARDLEGSPFIEALLDVLRVGRATLTTRRVVDGDLVVDLGTAFRNHVEPVVRERTTGGQRPELRQLRARGNRRIIPVVVVERGVDATVDDELVRLLRQAEEHGSDPVEIALQHLGLAAQVRSLSSSLHVLMTLLRRGADPLVGPAMALVARDARGRVETLDLGEAHMPSSHQARVREALGRRADLRALTAPLDDVAPNDVNEVLCDVVTPVRVAVEAGAVDLLRHALTAVSEEPMRALDRGDETFSLWAHAVDCLVAAAVRAARLASAGRAPDAVEGEVMWSGAAAGYAAIERALLVALARGRAGLPIDGVQRLLDDGGEGLDELAGLYRDWCRAAQDAILTDLSADHSLPEWLTR